MRQVSISLGVIAVGLLAAGCASDESTSSASLGLKGDQAQIQKSLSTMDRMEDRSIAMEKMEWLIENGLYDPENENPLELGTPAPDFELMPLRFYDFKIDQGITKDNAQTLFDPVRLSDFRGSLPVVLIFGSYT